MKTSNYNFFFKNEKNASEYIAFNARTSALALMSNEEYESLHNNEIENIGETLKEELKQGGFLIPKDLDELKKIRFEMNSARHSKQSFGFTIAPTSNCNFDCPYCYEKNFINCVTMSEETQDNLVKFVEANLMSRKVNSFHVTWYGGEPLLVPRIIKNLTARFKEICESLKITYTAGIVTNGYYLNKENAILLNECDVKAIQVTLDGDKEAHDSRRYLRGGQGTFDVIVKNLNEIKDIINSGISIRVNIDKSNVEKAYNVITELAKYNFGKKIVPYPAVVYNGHEEYEDNLCYSAQQFSEVEFKFYEKMLECGFDLNFIKFLPRQIRNSCCADSTSGFVINADGRIYKCWEDIGNNELSSGNISDRVIRFSERALDFMTYDPTSDEVCKDCKFLPICMGGGCPCHQRQKLNEKCVKYRYALEKYLKFATNLQNAGEYKGEKI